MAKKSSSREQAPAAVREIGRVTMVRLALYYLVAGPVLLLLTALLPEQALTPAGPAPPPGMTATLDWVQGRLALFPSGAPRWVDALVQMFAALLLVLPIAFVYVRTRTRVKFDHSLVQTVIVLPIVVTAILVVVRDSLALAFSLAGIVAAVRFRNNLKESGDAVYIFGSIGIGFATGIHALAVATVLSVFFVLLELALWKFNFSADFEHTFARLCLPTGADLADIPQATGEHPARTAGNGQTHLTPPSQPGIVPDRSTLLRVYVDQIEQAQPAVEAVLARDAKQWSLSEAKPSDGGPGVLEYRVRPRKSVGLDTLRQRLLREGAPHVVAAD
ncbi:MAG: DUF4956 domain-containing protein [Gemmatimonadales bacterium]